MNTQTLELESQKFVWLLPGIQAADLNSLRSKYNNNTIYYSSLLIDCDREIKICIPNSQSINRGNHRVDELVDACKKSDFSDIIILNETRGQPDAMIVCHLPFGPTASFTLSNCVMRHDIPDCTPASQAYPHIITDNLETKVGKRVATILQALYPVPRNESKRVISFSNRNDFVSFRHHMYSREKGEVTLKEAGPRFEMQPYEVWRWGGEFLMLMLFDS